MISFSFEHTFRHFLLDLKCGGNSRDTHREQNVLLDNGQHGVQF